MSRTRYLIIMVLLLVSGEMTAQYRVEGKVTDAESGKALTGVRCYVDGTLIQAVSDSTGYFLVEGEGNPGTIDVGFELFGYDEKRMQNISVFTTRTVKIEVAMTRNWRDLPEVPIYSEMPPDTVWGSEELHVADFVIHGENLLLLTYESEQRWKRQEEKDKTLFRGARLILINEGGEELMRTNVPGEVIEFYTMYPGEIFLEGRYERFYVVIGQNEITLETIEPAFFEEQVKPVVDTLGDQIFISTYNDVYPAFEYLSYNKADSIFHTLRYLINEDIMEMFRSEYKYLPPREKLEAFRYEVKTGIDKEIVAGYLTGFQYSPYFEPMNVPLFVMNDSLLIFDHHHDKLLVHAPDGTALDSLMISYHHPPRHEKWSGQLLRDEKTNALYTSYRSSGKILLKKIDIITGTAGLPFELTYSYAEKIKVYDGWAYYIWRPFESSQHRFLYKEKL